LQTSPRMSYTPYHDSPSIQAVAGADPQGAPVTSRAARRMPLDGPWDGESASEAEEEETQEEERPRTAATPPFLQPIERTPSLSMTFPSRANSQLAPVTGNKGLEPPVPRKSSRRGGSQDISQGNSPFTSPRLPAHFEGENERPTSMGHVQQRTAGDSMFQSGVGEGSRAEFVENERTMSFE